MVSYNRMSTYSSGGRRRRRFKTRSRVPRKPMTAGRVRRIIGAELKRHVTIIVDTAPAVSGSVTNLTDLILQGDAVNQRSGNRIKPINIHGYLVFRLD